MTKLNLFCIGRTDNSAEVRIKMKTVEHTANDEMPECGQCDHFDGSDGFKCKEWCGPEHGWFGYKRTERVDKE